METLGDRIKKIRTSQNLTQEQFGELFGISRSHISGIESDKEKPSDMFVRFVAYRYGLDYEYIKTGKYSEDDTSEKFINTRYREFRAHLDNFISEELIKKLEDDDISAFIFKNYITYALTLTGVTLFDDIGYNSDEYKCYLSLLNNLYSEIEKITTHGQDLVIEHRKKNNKNYNQYMLQATYMSDFNEGIAKINKILNEISDVFFTLCESNVTYKDSDIAFELEQELDF